MRFFLTVLIAALVVLCAFVVQKAISASRRRSAFPTEYEYGKECEMLVNSLLRSSFSRKSVLGNLYFPVVRGNDTLWTEVDVVCVTHGGIVVCEVKGAKGEIDNPLEGDWTQKYKDKELVFHNPYVQNKGHIVAVRNALERAGYRNIPLYNVVVFTDKAVRFTNRYSWLMRADKVVEFTSRLDDKNDLKLKDIKMIRSALAAYKVKHEPTAAEQYRKVR